MPNHLHGILLIADHSGNGESNPNPPIIPSGLRGTADGSLGRIIQAFKSETTTVYSRCVRMDGWEPFEGKLWQRNYHDHLIRDGDELARIRNYIMMNPLRWDEDDENPALDRPT